MSDDPMSGPAGAGAGSTKPLGSVFVPEPTTGKIVRRSARINNLEELTAQTERDAPLIEGAVAEAIAELPSQSGGAKTGPAGAGAGAGAAMEVEEEGTDLTPEPLAGTPYDLSAAGSGAELAAMVVGESLNAVYSAATSESVRKAATDIAVDLKGTGNDILDSLETVVVSIGDLFMDTVGTESAEVTIDTFKKLGGLGYWLLKGAGGIVILGLSLANFVAGTGKGLAEAGSTGIRALASKLRAGKTQEDARDVIIENSPLAILTTIAVFNQLGMLPLMTVASMALAGLQQQVSPVGRSAWLVYLFKWWVGLSKKEKEEVQAYTKEVVATGVGKVGEGATLVASAIAKAYEKDGAAPPSMADLASKLARARTPKGGKMSPADKASARVLAEEAAVAMAVLDLSDSEIGKEEDEVEEVEKKKTRSAKTKLAELKAGVAKAIQKVGEKKRARRGSEVEEESTPTAAMEVEPEEEKPTPAKKPDFSRFKFLQKPVPGSATAASVPGTPRGDDSALARGRRGARDRSRSRSPPRRGRETATPPETPPSSPPPSLRRSTRGQGPKGGKRTKKAKRRTFRAKKGKKTRGKTRAVRSFIY